MNMSHDQNATGHSVNTPGVEGKGSESLYWYLLSFGGIIIVTLIITSAVACINKRKRHSPSSPAIHLQDSKSNSIPNKYTAVTLNTSGRTGVSILEPDCEGAEGGAVVESACVDLNRSSYWKISDVSRALPSTPSPPLTPTREVPEEQAVSLDTLISNESSGSRAASYLTLFCEDEHGGTVNTFTRSVPWVNSARHTGTMGRRPVPEPRSPSNVKRHPVYANSSILEKLKKRLSKHPKQKGSLQVQRSDERIDQVAAATGMCLMEPMRIARPRVTRPKSRSDTATSERNEPVPSPQLNDADEHPKNNDDPTNASHRAGRAISAKNENCVYTCMNSPRAISDFRL